MSNARQQRFIHEYMVDFNATAAAIRAGYSPQAASTQATRLMSEPFIQVEIQRLQAQHASKCAVTAERVIAEFAKLGFANMLDYMKVGPDGDPVLDFSKLTRDQGAALTEVTVEDFVDGRGDDARDVKRVRFKLADKIGALTSLARHLGLFVDKTEITVQTNPRDVPPDATFEQIKEDYKRLRSLPYKQLSPPVSVED